MLSSSDAARIHPQLQCQLLPTQRLNDVVPQLAGHRCERPLLVVGQWEGGVKR